MSLPEAIGSTVHPERQPSGSFYNEYVQELSELFKLLGQRVPTGLSEAVAATQPWVKGDHFTPEQKIMLEGPAAEEAKMLYRSMDLVDEQPLPTGTYDQAVILGGTQRTNNARLQFFGEALWQGASLTPDGKTLLWAGERESLAVEQTATMANLAELIGDAAVAYDNAWLRAVRAGNAHVVSETELMRLAALARLGDLTISKLFLNVNKPGQPVRNRYEFQESGVVLLNAPPVDRPQGKARHTTESCAEFWLETIPPPLDARVAFITSNPYRQRTAADVKKVLYAKGRDDVQLVSAGPAAYKDAADHLFLGEIARNLYQDSLRQN